MTTLKINALRLLTVVCTILFAWLSGATFSTVAASSIQFGPTTAPPDTVTFDPPRLNLTTGTPATVTIEGITREDLPIHMEIHVPDYLDVDEVTCDAATFGVPWGEPVTRSRYDYGGCYGGWNEDTPGVSIFSISTSSRHDQNLYSTMTISMTVTLPPGTLAKTQDAIMVPLLGLMGETAELPITLPANTKQARTVTSLETPEFSLTPRNMSTEPGSSFMVHIWIPRGESIPTRHVQLTLPPGLALLGDPRCSSFADDACTRTSVDSASDGTTLVWWILSPQEGVSMQMYVEVILDPDTPEDSLTIEATSTTGTLSPSKEPDQTERLVVNVAP